jgi:hypothetical protein
MDNFQTPSKNYQVGDKVMCLMDASQKTLVYLIENYDFPEEMPIKGQIYVIKEVGEDSIKLIGCPVYKKGTEIDMGWKFNSFKKIEEIKAIQKENFDIEHSADLAAIDPVELAEIDEYLNKLTNPTDK